MSHFVELATYPRQITDERDFWVGLGFMVPRTELLVGRIFRMRKTAKPGVDYFGIERVVEVIDAPEISGISTLVIAARSDNGRIENETHQVTSLGFIYDSVARGWLGSKLFGPNRQINTGFFIKLDHKF